MEKTCRGACGRVLPLDEFYAHKLMSDGHLNYCKSCVRERVRQRSSSAEGRGIARARYARDRSKVINKVIAWHAKHPERSAIVKRAARAVRMALRAGVIKRKTQCERCGTSAALEAAHKTYANLTDVLWLCRHCHRQWDSENPKAAASPSLDVSTFTISGIEYTAILESDPRLPGELERWVIYGNRTRFRAVALDDNRYAVVSDRVAGNTKPLRKGPLQNVALKLEDGKLMPF